MARFLTETSIPNYAKTSRIIYDAEGETQGIELSASSDTECNSLGIFSYRKNLQGDITGLINTEGKLLCEFTYDAYGNIGIHTESTLGALFPGSYTEDMYIQLWEMKCAITWVPGSTVQSWADS